MPVARRLTYCFRLLLIHSSNRVVRREAKKMKHGNCSSWARDSMSQQFTAGALQEKWSASHCNNEEKSDRLLELLSDHWHQQLPVDQACSRRFSRKHYWATSSPCILTRVFTDQLFDGPVCLFDSACPFTSNCLLLLAVKWDRAESIGRWDRVTLWW